MALALTSAARVYPVVTTGTRGRGSNGSWRTSNARFSVSGERTTNYGKAGNVHRHFVPSCDNRSSPLHFQVPKRILRLYSSSSSGASTTDVSSSPTNGREGPLSGTVSAESDHPAAKKRSLEATPERANNESGFEFEQAFSDFSVWKVFQRGAALVVVACVIACTFLPEGAHAIAENSIGASRLGIKVAEFLRRSGLPDELVVLTVATVPVLELRGAIPISYWLKVEPVRGYMLAVIGNMIPVPFIVLYLGKILKTVGEKSETGLKFAHWIVDRTRKKAGPIEEFEWLGLLLFVAVPLPGTGAWSGAICASILGMPFWDALTANFIGVMLAGLLVTLLVRVGTKEAVLVGIAMIVSSCFVWSVLRLFQQKKKGASPS